MGLLLRFLEKLQTSLRKVIKGVGGLSHEQWRSFSNEKKTVEAKNFLDGDLIESFLDLSRSKMDEISKQTGVSVEELCKRVEELTRLHWGSSYLEVRCLFVNSLFPHFVTFWMEVRKCFLWVSFPIVELSDACVMYIYVKYVEPNGVCFLLGVGIIIIFFNFCKRVGWGVFRGDRVMRYLPWV